MLRREADFMKTRLYQKAAPSRFRRMLFVLVRLFLSDYFRGLNAESLTTIGKGVSLTNLIFQKLLQVNAPVPFMVNYTSRVILWDAIKFPDNINDCHGIYESFASSGACYYQAYNGIEFAGPALWGPGVKFISANHDLSDYAVHQDATPIRVGRNTWIGANAVILPSVSIGDSAVVGAGAVVTKDVLNNTIVAGNPARVIKEIK